MAGPFGTNSTSIGAITVHPTNANTVLAATNKGVYLSTDGGTDWTLEISGTATGVVFDP